MNTRRAEAKASARILRQWRWTVSERRGNMELQMILEQLIGHALGRTQAGQFFNGLMMLFFAAALPIGSVAGFSVFAWREFAKESRYQRRFGADWKAQFQAEEGSLTAARIKVGAAMFAAVANTFLGVLLYRQLFPALRGVGYATRPPRARLRRRNRTHR